MPTIIRSSGTTVIRLDSSTIATDRTCCCPTTSIGMTCTVEAASKSKCGFPAFDGSHHFYEHSVAQVSGTIDPGEFDSIQCWHIDFSAYKESSFSFTNCAFLGCVCSGGGTVSCQPCSGFDVCNCQGTFTACGGGGTFAPFQDNVSGCASDTDISCDGVSWFVGNPIHDGLCAPGTTVITTRTTETVTYDCEAPLVPTTSIYHGNYYEELSVEYTTQMLIANTEAALTSVGGSCIASRELNTNETSYSISRFTPHFTFTSSPTGRILTYDQITVPDAGGTFTTPIEVSVPAGATTIDGPVVSWPDVNGTRTIGNFKLKSS